MAVPTTAGFVARYPEFSATETAVLESRLSLATLELEPIVWDRLYESGIYALMGHYLTLDGMDSVDSGIVTSRTVGDVSVSYGSYLTADVGDREYNMSKYGREYMRLMRLVSSGPWVV